MIVAHVAGTPVRVEDVDAREAGRPRRRYYKLTGAGVTAAGEAVDAVRQRRTRGARTEGLAW